MNEPVRIGVIGGSGLYEMAGVEVVAERELTTPFGPPSAPYTIVRIAGTEVAFLPRHGRGHVTSPSEVNSRANIFGFKTLGVEWLISVSACGSLKEEIAPGHFVFMDQIIDRTRAGRPATFFGGGLVGHVQFADPICPTLRKLLVAAARAAGITHHDGGTMVCMEGPAFSTRAESHLYRSWGCAIVGMTALPEAKLAREAEMSYATIAMATDYDCWRAHDADVDVADILRIIRENVNKAQEVIRRVVPRLLATGPSPQADALKFALITDRGRVPKNLIEKLRPIVGKYFPET